MEDYLSNMEYYSSEKKCYVMGEIKGIIDEDSYLMKNEIDETEEICDSDNIRKIINISSVPLKEKSYIIEYIKGDNEFIEVTIKEKKGLFYLLETEDEEGYNSTFLSRQKQLRYIEYIPFDEYIKDKYINLTLDITPELHSLINSNRIKDILYQLKGEESTNEVYMNTYPKESPKTLRLFFDIDKKDKADALINTALFLEKDLINISTDKENAKKELEDLQKKNKILYLDKNLIGFIIGKEGANIKSLKSKYNVNIIIDNKKSNKKKEEKITITGENELNVEECYKEINIVEKIYELSENIAIELKKRANGIIEEYKFKRFHISNDNNKNENGNSYKGYNLTVVGILENINNFYNKEIKDIEGNYYDDYNANYSSYKTNYKRYNNNNNYYYNNYKGYNSYIKYK